MAAVLLVTCVAILAPLVASCRAQLEEPDRFLCTGKYSAPETFRAKCADAGCHGNEGTRGGDLDLVSPDVWGRLYLHHAQGAAGLLISDEGPDESLLVEKISGTPSFGAPMPFLAAPLSSGEIACVERWIEDNLAAGTPAAPTASATSGAP